MTDYKRNALELLNLSTTDGEAAIVNAILHHADIAERASAHREVTVVERALDAVVVLHKRLRTDPTTCAECAASYPCLTLRTITDHLSGKP